MGRNNTMDLEKISIIDRIDFIIDKHDIMSHYVDYWHQLLNGRYELIVRI